MDNMPATTPSNDSRKLNKDAPFHLDPSYYTEQLEKELATRTRELRMQMAGFEQLQDLFNNLVDTLASCESELEKTRGEIRDHEKLAVDQQMVVDEFAEFKKLLANQGTDFAGLLEDLRKTEAAAEARRTAPDAAYRVEGQLAENAPVTWNDEPEE